MSRLTEEEKAKIIEEETLRAEIRNKTDDWDGGDIFSIILIATWFILVGAGLYLHFN